MEKIKPPERIKLYWAWCGPRHGNWGDELSRLVLSTLTGVPVEYALLTTAHILACGSLAQELTPDYEGYVWGTGLMFRDRYALAPNATICALRGKLTAMRCSYARHDTPLGDVGILCSHLWPITEGYHAPHRLGIVPHYVDYDNAGVGSFLRKNPDAIVIDPCAPVMKVLNQIRSCQHIISSGLHGLVAADSYGIPNAWARWSDKVAGGDFKFHDHVSIFDIETVTPIPFSMDDTTETLIARINWHGGPGLAERQRDLLEAFPYEVIT